MTNAVSIENGRGLVASIMHRFLLVIYATTMICPQSSLQDDAVFGLIIVCYFTVVYVFRRRGVCGSLLRMTADVMFIYYVLAQYNLWDFKSCVFTVIPLFCKSVLSDENFSSFLYLSLPALMIFVFKQDVGFTIVPFAILFAIALIGLAKHHVLKTASELDDVIDNFFVSGSNNSKSYSIYKNSIPLFNKFPFSAGVKTIFCFRYSGVGFQLVNGSKFVFKYQILTPECLMPLIKQERGGAVEGLVVDMDGVQSSVDEVYPVKVGGETYLFMLTFDMDKRPISYSKLLFPRFFARMANVVHAERKRKELEDEVMRNLSLKVNYVDAATDTMHFIRNKLSPLSTYISMKEDYEKSDDEKRSRILPHLDKTFRKVISAYNMIVRRANIMLEESDDPFNYTATVPYGIQKLYSEIRSHWQSYDLSESSIIVKLLDKPKEKGERKYIYYNADGMFLVLDNWIHNMKKHGVGNLRLQITESEVSYSLIFENQYDLEKGDEFIKLFSSNERNEILKRKWHGLQIIKDALAQMKIQGVMTGDHKTVKLRITLAKITKYEENTDH